MMMIFTLLCIQNSKPDMPAKANCSELIISKTFKPRHSKIETESSGNRSNDNRIMRDDETWRKIKLTPELSKLKTRTASQAHCSWEFSNLAPSVPKARQANWVQLFELTQNFARNGYTGISLRDEPRVDGTWRISNFPPHPKPRITRENCSSQLSNGLPTFYLRSQSNRRSRLSPAIWTIWFQCEWTKEWVGWQRQKPQNGSWANSLTFPQTQPQTVHSNAAVRAGYGVTAWIPTAKPYMCNVCWKHYCNHTQTPLL